MTGEGSAATVPLLGPGLWIHKGPARLVARPAGWIVLVPTAAAAVVDAAWALLADPPPAQEVPDALAAACPDRPPTDLVVALRTGPTSIDLALLGTAPLAVHDAEGARLLQGEERGTRCWQLPDVRRLAFGALPPEESRGAPRLEAGVLGIRGLVQVLQDPAALAAAPRAALAAEVTRLGRRIEEPEQAARREAAGAARSHPASSLPPPDRAAAARPPVAGITAPPGGPRPATEDGPRAGRHEHDPRAGRLARPRAGTEQPGPAVAPDRIDQLFAGEFAPLRNLRGPGRPSEDRPGPARGSLSAAAPAAPVPVAPPSAARLRPGGIAPAGRSASGPPSLGDPTTGPPVSGPRTPGTPAALATAAEGRARDAEPAVDASMPDPARTEPSPQPASSYDELFGSTRQRRVEDAAVREHTSPDTSGDTLRDGDVPPAAGGSSLDSRPPREAAPPVGPLPPPSSPPALIEHVPGIDRLERFPGAPSTPTPSAPAQTAAPVQVPAPAQTAAPAQAAAPAQLPAPAQLDAPVRRVARLVAVRAAGPPGERTVLTLDRDAVIGRRPRAARPDGTPRLLTVPSPAQGLSRSHLAVHLVDGQVRISDLGTLNGTVLHPRGGESRTLRAREQVVLADGDRLVLGGEVELTYREAP